jgi:hypothetical protein
MTIPTKYAAPQEQAVASYSFYDLTTKVGYKTFYGAKFKENATDKFYLVTDRIDPTEFATNSNNNTALEINYDLGFNVPLIMKGTAFFTCTFRQTGSGGTTATITAYHVNEAGTETQLGDSVDEIFATGTTPYNNYFIHGAAVVIPNRKFKAGEKFRLSVSTTAGGAGSSVNHQHDPNNITAVGDIGVADYPITALTAVLPFRIDL